MLKRLQSKAIYCRGGTTWYCARLLSCAEIWFPSGYLGSKSVRRGLRLKVPAAAFFHSKSGKMKKAILLILMLLILPVCHGIEESRFYNSGHMLLDVRLSTELEVVSLSPSPKIDFITANISFFPKETAGQAIRKTDFSPEPESIGETAVFRWDKPSQSRLFIDMDSIVKVENDPVRVSGKIRFPLENIPDEARKYTLPAEIIDIDENIINTASDIASGKDDLMDVVDSIAVWVNTNISYNFSTITAEASQKSSWVLENREGVCDEITSLFISMLRSLGIPARFVAGISYTNSPQIADNWGPHGWAEVYFPGYGWVPYDVTYGEYGWVDPTHIVTSISSDAEKITSTYQWKAEGGVSLDLNDLETQIGVLEIGDEKGHEVSIESDVMEDETGFSSYNVIKARITNLKDYYVSKDIRISRTSRLDILGAEKKHVLLRPGEVKEASWIVKVQGGLDRDYIYTFPYEVFTLDNATSGGSFSSMGEGSMISLEEARKSASASRKRHEKAYAGNLEVSCTNYSDRYYTYESPSIECSIRNVGNIFFRNLSICLAGRCAASHLGITQQKNFTFTIENVEKGRNELSLYISNERVSKSREIAFEGIPSPEFSIGDVEFPAEVGYGDEFSVRFSLDKASEAPAHNALVGVYGAGLEREYDYGMLEEGKEYELELKGSGLQEGKNPIHMNLSYEDARGRKYSDSEKIEISLVDVSFIQRILLFFRHLF